VLEVDMTPDATTYRLIEGHGLLVQHWDEVVRLTPDTPVRRPVEVERPVQAVPTDEDDLPLAA
jgi:hypothetical protein